MKKLSLLCVCLFVIGMMVSSALAQVPVPCEIDENCDDGVECTVDSCDESTNTCTAPLDRDKPCKHVHRFSP